MIRYSHQYICPKGLSESLHSKADRRLVVTYILDYLLNTFQIEDIELYRQIAEIFDEYIEKRLL